MWVGLDSLKRDQRERDLHQLSLPICFLAVMRVKNPIRGKKKEKGKGRTKILPLFQNACKMRGKMLSFHYCRKKPRDETLNDVKSNGKMDGFFFPLKWLSSSSSESQNSSISTLHLYFSSFPPTMSVPLVRPAGRPWIGSVMIRRPPQNSDIHMPWAAVLEGKEPCSSFLLHWGVTCAAVPGTPRCG